MPQLSREESEKSSRHSANIAAAPPPPKTPAKADTESESEAAEPYGMAAPEQSRARPVNVQITKVSAKTSKMP